MGNQRKSLGSAGERAVVKAAQTKGLRARRQPLSGALAEFPGDVEIERLLAEVKVRSTRLDAKGARTLTIDLEWLEKVRGEAKRAKYDAAAVFIRPKGSPRFLVLMEMDTVLDLLANG